MAHPPDQAAPDWLAVDAARDQTRIWAMSSAGDVLEAASVAAVGNRADLDALLQPWTDATPGLPVLCAAAWPGQMADRALPCTPLPEAYAPDVPRLVQTAPQDVIAGDAVRVAGFLSVNAGWDGVICVLGATSRWMLVSAGEIISAQSFLTGRLADALVAELRLPPPNMPDRAALLEAVDATLSRPEALAAQLGGIEAALALRHGSDAVNHARLHGALVGAELAAARPYWLGQQVAVIGPSTPRTDLYTAALAHVGVPATVAKYDEMTRLGFVAARRLP